MRGEAGREKLFYIYALAERGLPRRFTVLGRRLQTIDVGRVAAIVEVVSEAPVTEEALRRQHAVVTRLSERAAALLPVRFGAICTRAELEARVKSAEDVMLAALRRVRGCVQVTVRVHAPLERDTSPAPPSSGTAYLVARSERGRMLRNVAGRIRRAVSHVVADQRIDEGKGQLLGTVYHLIRSDEAGEYRSALDAVAPLLAPLRLVVTGPWPVFAFVPDLSGESRGNRRRGSRGSRPRGSHR
jgi:hypothetical protein